MKLTKFDIEEHNQLILINKYLKELGLVNNHWEQYCLIYYPQNHRVVYGYLLRN